MAINHIYAACFNRKRPLHEQGVVNVLHRPTGTKWVILSLPVRQTRSEVEMSSTSAFERSLWQTPFSPILVNFNELKKPMVGVGPFLPHVV